MTLVPAGLRLGPSEVHVWRVRLQLRRAEIDRLESLLTRDERERAARYRFRADADRFVAARTALRAILAQYLGRRPADLRFSCGPQGKPALREDTWLRFNVAHSGGLGLIAVSQERELGIDIEIITGTGFEVEIAERFFSATEVATLSRLPSGERTAAFFRCWTRKEAYIKARGQGLSLQLDSFDVSFAPGEPARLLATRPDPRDVERWTILDFAAAEGYAVALAVEGGACAVRCFAAPEPFSRAAEEKEDP